MKHPANFLIEREGPPETLAATTLLAEGYSFTLVGDVAFANPVIGECLHPHVQSSLRLNLFQIVGKTSGLVGGLGACLDSNFPLA